MSTSAPSIYRYPSLAAFLSAHLSWRREQNAGFSYRFLCKRLGLRSTSKIAMVATGKRLPTPAFLQDLGEALGFSCDELAYAQALVLLARAKTDDERHLYTEKLQLLAPADDGATLSLDSFEFISRWWHIAILEMTELPQFSQKPADIASRLGGLLSAEQAEASVALLCRLGLLCADDDGRLSRTAVQFITPKNVPSQTVRAYHSEILGLANVALATQSVDERYFSASTVPVDPANIAEAQKLIADFRRKMLRLVQKGTPTEVYELSVQLFRLTSPKAP